MKTIEQRLLALEAEVVKLKESNSGMRVTINRLRSAFTKKFGGAALGETAHIEMRKNEEGVWVSVEQEDRPTA